jgi:mono/diheme cytochrome c family protein
MVKTLLLVSSVILFGVAATPNPGGAYRSEGQEPAVATGAKNPVKPTAESQSKAKKTYGFDCALCHGATGDGKTDLAKDMQLTLSDLTDPKTLADKTDSQLFDIIRKGKDKMPPEEAARAKDEDIWNLVIYVRSLSKGSSTASAAPAQ